MPCISKLLRLLRKPKIERRKVDKEKLYSLVSSAFKYIISSMLKLNIGYKPDHFSKIMGGAFAPLKEKFIRNNEVNNDGDLTRLCSLMRNLEQLHEDGTEGNFAELGVYKGNTAAILARYATIQNRKLYLFDTFT